MAAYQRSLVAVYDPRFPGPTPLGCPHSGRRCPSGNTRDPHALATAVDRVIHLCPSLYLPPPGPSGEQLAAQRLRTRGSLGEALRQAPEFTERAVETIAAYERAVPIAPREVRRQRVAVAASGAVASETHTARLNLQLGDSELAAGNVSAAQARLHTVAGLVTHGYSTHRIPPHAALTTERVGRMNAGAL